MRTECNTGAEERWSLTAAELEGETCRWEPNELYGQAIEELLRWREEATARAAAAQASSAERMEEGFNRLAVVPAHCMQFRFN